MLRLKLIASRAWALANGESSRLIMWTSTAARTPASPAIQLVISASTNADRCASAAHWRSLSVGDRVCGRLPSAVCSIVCSRPEDRTGTHTGWGLARPAQPNRCHIAWRPPQGRGRPFGTPRLFPAGLLHQPQRERIAVGAAFVGLDRRDDGEPQPDWKSVV